jgi:hypothetical protein
MFDDPNVAAYYYHFLATTLYVVPQITIVIEN